KRRAGFRVTDTRSPGPRVLRMSLEALDLLPVPSVGAVQAADPWVDEAPVRPLAAEGPAGGQTIDAKCDQTSFDQERGHAERLGPIADVIHGSGQARRAAETIADHGHGGQRSGGQPGGNLGTPAPRQCRARPRLA